MPWYHLSSSSKSRRPTIRRVLQSATVIAMLALLAFHSEASAQTALSDFIPLDQLDTPTDDLIRLSTGYAEALRDYKVAKLSIDTVTTLRPNVIITNLEVQISQTNLEAAERKVQLLRMIVEKRLAAAENKLRIMNYLNTKFGKPDGAQGGGQEMSFLRSDDEATVEILRAILAMK